MEIEVVYEETEEVLTVRDEDTDEGYQRCLSAIAHWMFQRDTEGCFELFRVSEGDSAPTMGLVADIIDAYWELD